jgi:hypothetical protein
VNFPEGSEELEQIMTDKDGRRRRITIPPGMITWDAWEMLKAKAVDKLPPQMAEMVRNRKCEGEEPTTDSSCCRPISPRIHLYRLSRT